MYLSFTFGQDTFGLFAEANICGCRRDPRQQKLSLPAGPCRACASAPKQTYICKYCDFFYLDHQWFGDVIMMCNLCHTIKTDRQEQKIQSIQGGLKQEIAFYQELHKCITSMYTACDPWKAENSECEWVRYDQVLEIM